MWLRDMLAKEKDLNARVMTFNHNTSWEAYALNKSLRDHGNDLLQALRTARHDGKAKSRPIIFIGHSFGGLIIKQALVNADPADNFGFNVRDKAYGFIFLGTPHKGASIAPAGRILSLFGSWKGSSTSLLEYLKPGSQINNGLHQAFLTYLDRKIKRTVCVYEAVKQAFYRMPIIHVVDRSSAVIDQSIEIGFEKDHRNMQRFSDPEDEDYKKILGYIKDWAKEADAQLRDKTQDEQDCLRSLSFQDMEQRPKLAAGATTKTCAWLLKHENYTSWLAQPHPVLCIVGKPGTGKSTLLNYAFEKARDEAQHSNDVIASFFFFDRGSDLRKSSCGLFRSLLHQLLNKDPDMLPAFKKTGSDHEWAEKELQTLLKEWILSPSRNRPIRIYVDALDEAGRDDAAKLMKYFEELTKPPSPAGASFQICFSCRHYPVVVPKDALKISVEEENNEDIATYVQENLKDHFSDANKAELEREIIGKASSIFQWVVLVIPIIIKSQQDGENVRKIRQEIEKIPSELSDLYEHILSPIKEQKQKGAVQLMQWVCFAERSLSLEELRFAMVVDVTNELKSLQDYKDSVDFAETDEQMRLRVTSYSGGLAETVKVANKHIVQFIHQSVKDYLIEGGLQKLDTSFFHDVNGYLRRGGLPSLDESLSNDVVGLAHFRISRSCVKYVTLEEVLGDVERYDRPEARRGAGEVHRRFPFLRYANKWTSHAEIVEKQRIPQIDLLDLFRWPSKDTIESWVQFMHVDEYLYTNFHERSPGARTSLGVFSRYGLLSVVKAMIKRDGLEIDSKEVFGRTPLLLAAQWGHEDVVRLLIEKGADIDSKDRRGRTSLSEAAGEGREDMVRLLIEKGADIDSKDHGGQTSLSEAAGERREDMVRLLIEKGADIDSKDVMEVTPLLRAVKWGHKDMIRLLIELGADIKSKDRYGRTLLFEARRQGHENVVSLLIEKGGIDIDSKES
ncbi:hypothetical protein HO173_003431 [Letharia columbiana]|uniref:Uncharacterized protein n=1 Tax=Letharia columbiana TaxID=112416 RepID=A0A8H6L7D2_9LECA|nr:uncharacterized protein HO173_003431 [Letharia columbiana]KAF6238464.1 hypothetical protein HO173_003431 [Letharia columbiana]